MKMPLTDYRNACAEAASGPPCPFVGDPVALIAATSNRIAEEAADLIEVEYEILPAVHDLDEAIADGAPAVIRAVS